MRHGERTERMPNPGVHLAPAALGQADSVMTTVLEESLVKSREREVFTPRDMVDKMLDPVTDVLEDGPDFVDKTVLEPAAGDGNFLIAILQRKLRAIERRMAPVVWAQESLFALASIYGIELLEDNHADARAALLEGFLDFHRRSRVAYDRFLLRVWDRDALVDAVLNAYDQLPEYIRTDLPLRRIWVLNTDEEQV